MGAPDKFYFDKEELPEIEALAQFSGLAFSAYIRKIVEYVLRRKLVKKTMLESPLVQAKSHTGNPKIHKSVQLGDVKKLVQGELEILEFNSPDGVGLYVRAAVNLALQNSGIFEIVEIVHWGKKKPKKATKKK